MAFECLRPNQEKKERAEERALHRKDNASHDKLELEKSKVLMNALSGAMNKDK